MSVEIKRTKYIYPKMEDFEAVKAESAIGAYRGKLIQLYFPSDDPKRSFFRIGRVGHTKTSKREVPGTDRLDFAVYLQDFLGRPELVYDSVLYLEKKDGFGTTTYVPRIVGDGTKFVLMEDDEKNIEEYKKKLKGEKEGGQNSTQDPTPELELS